MPFPKAVRGELAAYPARVKALHRRDLAAGYGRVWLPDALDRKLPNVAAEWKWQYVFPSVAGPACRGTAGRGAIDFEFGAGRPDRTRRFGRFKCLCRAASEGTGPRCDG
jgi:hypothetical protein